MSETVYVRFTNLYQSFNEGELREAILLKRVANYVLVQIETKSGAEILSWSGFSNFEEVSEMEVLALSADGKLDLDV